MPTEVDYSDSFKRSLKRLAKKYRHIKQDVQPVIDEIVSGKTPGDQIPHVGYEVYKVRVNNSDSRQGKRGGYRIIYYVVHQNRRLLITLYSKAEQSDIGAEAIRRIIAASE